MLSPDVWNFVSKPPSVNITPCDSEEKVFERLKYQYFNQHIRITLPDTIQIPKILITTLTEDSQYYKINNVPAFEFIKEDFIKFFVKKGCLTAISLCEFSDLNSLVITPCGKLITSLTQNSFQKLGIDSSNTKNFNGFSKKYCVNLDLVSDINDSKKKCEQLCKKLALHDNLCFNVILAWEPESTNICPSSIASYFSKKGYLVNTCDVLYQQKLFYNVEVPLLNEESDVSDVIEWLGVLSLECDISNNNLFSSLRCPENNQMFGQVMQLQLSGLITQSRLKKIISEINKYLNAKTPSVWYSLTVNSLQNGILGMKNQNLFLFDGDHHNTVFFRWNQPFLIYAFQHKS